MSDAKPQNWKAKLLQAAVVAGIALVGYNTVLLSQPIEGASYAGSNGALTQSTTLEEAVARYHGGSKYALIGITADDVRTGTLDKRFDVKEATEEGRLAAINARNNEFGNRLLDATSADLSSMAKKIGMDSFETDNAATKAVKFAAHSVLGAGTVITWPRNVVSISISDARAMMADDVANNAEAKQNLSKMNDLSSRFKTILVNDTSEPHQEKKKSPKPS